MRKIVSVIIISFSGFTSFAQSSRTQHMADSSLGKGRIVLLDSYFNDEHKKDNTGKLISYHYKWEDKTYDGFSVFGTVFNKYGLKTATLYTAPTTENLKQVNIYIIVDPDIPKENPNAKYIEKDHIKAISEWVKKGGVLLVMNNDTGNAEFVHLNKLMAKFGIQFNYDSRNHEEGNNFEQAAIYIGPDNEIFKTAHKVYIKGISTISVISPAKSALTDKGDIIIAVAKYGKGTVFAVGDPWFYNEYTNGRLTPDFQNLQAANDLVKWLIRQIPAK
jgi:unsaturated rhamnogalacturonyl hydrolase